MSVAQISFGRVAFSSSSRRRLLLLLQGQTSFDSRKIRYTVEIPRYATSSSTIRQVNSRCLSSFMVRNIGNQLATARGSVQYGVNHLGSSLLLFIGHSACGAIKAASGDYASLEPDIKRELDTINITKGSANIDGVKTNVNNQVAAALKEFADKVKNGELLVVGAVYDFADDMKQGAGKLNIINMNGETDPARISSMSAGEAKAAHAHAHH